jgi:hypothetical protein
MNTYGCYVWPIAISTNYFNPCHNRPTNRSLQFFFKMAVLICMTILLSTLYSIFWLMALLALVGPQNTVGDISFVKRFVKGCLGWDRVDGTAKNGTSDGDTSEGAVTVSQKKLSRDRENLSV